MKGTGESMKIYKQAIMKVLEEEGNFDELVADIGVEAVERCFKAVNEIALIIRTEKYDDKCFNRIERIISELERLGIDIGTRHDFG